MVRVCAFSTAVYDCESAVARWRGCDACEWRHEGSAYILTGAGHVSSAADNAYSRTSSVLVGLRAARARTMSAVGFSSRHNKREGESAYLGREWPR